MSCLHDFCDVEGSDADCVKCGITRRELELEELGMAEIGSEEVDKLYALIAEARRLGNLTVRDSNEVACWHRAVDAALRDTQWDNPDDRYDTPGRIEHRKFVASLFEKQ